MSERTILLFGDSNTHGTRPIPRFDAPRERFGAAVRWPGVLRAALPPGTDVIEEGHPGRTTLHDDPMEGAHKNGLAALPALLESHAPLDMVVIALGVNDLKSRFAVTPEDVAHSVRILCRAVRAAEAGRGGAAPDLVIVAPPPLVETGFLGGYFRGGAAKSAALPALLAEVAGSLGAGFVESGAHIAVSPVDGVHFEAEAHAALGRAVAAVVLPRLAALEAGG